MLWLTWFEILKHTTLVKGKLDLQRILREKEKIK